MTIHNPVGVGFCHYCGKSISHLAGDRWRHIGDAYASRVYPMLLEDNDGRTCLVFTDLPKRVKPKAVARQIAKAAKAGLPQGIVDVRVELDDDGMERLVVVLRHDAVARIVLLNLFKYTDLQHDAIPDRATAYVWSRDRRSVRLHNTRLSWHE